MVYITETYKPRYAKRKDSSAALMLCLGRRTKRNKSSEAIDAKMLVSETIFSRHNVRVLVISADGREWSVDLDGQLTSERLKLMALGHFYNPAETVKIGSQYKLVLVAADRKLNDNLTLEQEGVQQDDELLLLKRNFTQTVKQETETFTRESQWKGPDAATVKQRTSHLPSKNEDRVAEDSITVVDFQVELRKALVTLIDCAQRIQMTNENALPLFCQSTDNVPLEAVDPGALKQLTDMGFSSSSARSALLENKMSSMDALESLLLTHHIVAPEGTKVNELTTQESKPCASSGKISADHVLQLLERKSEPGDNLNSGSLQQSETPVASHSSRLPSLPELMEAFRAYKRREFRPNHRAFANLREMGFDQDKIADALRVGGNNQDAAFEWLISQWPTAQDFSEGLEPDGAIHKALMTNPVIRLGLNSPKVLYAFLHMLENPNCANHWLNDPDAAPLLSQIFKIYHAEKYSLQIRPSAGNW